MNVWLQIITGDEFNYVAAMQDAHLSYFSFANAT